MLNNYFSKRYIKMKYIVIFILVFSTKLYAFAGLEDLVEELDKAVGEVIDADESPANSSEKNNVSTECPQNLVNCPGVPCRIQINNENDCKRAQNEMKEQERITKETEEARKEEGRKAYAEEQERKAKEQAYMEKQKKEEAEKKAKEQEQTIAKRKNRDTRGKWGFKFNMTFSEAEKLKGCDGSADFFLCHQDGDNTYLTFDYNPYRNDNDPDPFLMYFYRSYGEYNKADFNKFVNSAQKKYKLIKEPTSGEKEKFIYGKSDLIYLFKNQTDKESPLYMSVRTQDNIANKKIISIFYYETTYFESTILKSLNKDKKKFDDI